MRFKTCFDIQCDPQKREREMRDVGQSDSDGDNVKILKNVQKKGGIKRKKEKERHAANGGN